jgi:hypothetical protein
MSAKNTLKSVIKDFKALVQLKGNPEDDDQNLMSYCLRKSMSFRLPESAKTDRLIGFRVWRRMNQAIKRNQAKAYPEGLGDAMIIQGVARNKERISEYISFQSQQRIPYFIAKDELPFQQQKISASDRRALQFFSLKTALHCLFNKDRKNRALWPWFCLENWALTDFSSRENIKTAFDFAPYLIDANYYTKALQQKKVTVFKVPSSGPLKAHNKYILGDVLVLSTPYQFMEREKFKATIRVGKVAKWIPERALEYIQQYQNPTLPEPPQSSIGYYSHGGWLRKASGHADNGLNIPTAELQLMEDLSTWLREAKDKELIIFLHPKEKSADVIEQTKAFYQKHFGEFNYRFADTNKATSEGFHLVDLGIAVYSTVLYERLFAGYKSIIGNYGMSDFPDPDASLSRICFQSKSALDQALDEAFAVDRQGFFEKNGLLEYRFDTYEATARIPKTLS